MNIQLHPSPRRRKSSHFRRLRYLGDNYDTQPASFTMAAGDVEVASVRPSPATGQAQAA